MRIQWFSLICAAVFCAAFATTTAAAEAPPQTTHDGLVLVPSKNVQLLYARPGASLAGYKRVAILDCFVAFRKNWQRDQNDGTLRVTSSDMTRIKNALSKEFHKVFVDEFQNKGGYEVVEEAGEDVLLLRPAIINLDVTAPDTMSAGRGRSFATSSGEMTLYLEVYDSSSGEILARAVDREQARDNGRMMWQSSVTNRAEADRLLRKWASLARAALDQAAAAPAPVAQ